MTAPTKFRVKMIKQNGENKTLNNINISFFLNVSKMLSAQFLAYCTTSITSNLSISLTINKKRGWVKLRLVSVHG